MSTPSRAFWVGLALLPLLAIVMLWCALEDACAATYRFCDELGSQFLHDRPWEDDDSIFAPRTPAGATHREDGRS